MAYPDYSTMPDSTGTSTRMGDPVTYHGSLAEALGAWTYAGPCCCGNCGGTTPDGELIERRMRLTREEAGGTRPLLHVSTGHVTRA
jgi:hypothetical protein